MKANLARRFVTKMPHAALGLACLSLFAILCFRFPEYLTTPGIRKDYPIDLFRNLIRASMFAACGLAILGLAIPLSDWTPSAAPVAAKLSLLSIALLLLGLLLGGPDVPLKTEFQDASIQVGLDWFVLNLFVLAIVFIPLEALFPLRRHQRVLRPGLRTDLVYFAVGHLGIQIIALLSQKPAEYWFTELGWRPFGLWISQQNIPLQVLIALLVSDLIQYWIHRAFHETPWLWKFHKAHHSIKILDWLAGSRLHLADIICVRSVVYFFVLLLGLSPQAFLAYLLIVAFHATLNHTNIKMNLGLFEYLIASNRFHHWHHNDRPETFNTNYAVHFPFIDKIFGTYYFPKGKWPEVYGVDEPGLPQSYWGQFIHPFR